jgi:hypothetical protein
MSTPLDDMPALEAAPMLFNLTHLSEAAASASSSVRGKGVKRSRSDEESEEESDFSHDSDEAEDEDDATAIAPTMPSNEAGVAGVWDDGADDDEDDDGELSTRRSRPKKEADIDGVARARFPIVQSVASTCARESCEEVHRACIARAHGLISRACRCSSLRS